jgi:hypothetical protein
MRMSLSHRVARLSRRARITNLALLAAVAGVLTVVLTTASAGSDSTPTHPLRADQTEGFGNDRLLGFTYGQNFSCIHRPGDDLDHNGVPADLDPAEFQAPHCTAGIQPPIGPTGDPIDNTEPLFVIVPFFDGDNDGEAADGLAPTLRSLFGVVPDAFDPTPGEDVQCPEPGPPLTEHKGAFGTCTMHTTKIDLGPVLHSLGLIPADQVVQLPTPNHSHIIDGGNFGSIWWKVVVVLVTDKSVWPNAAGTTGITSLTKLRAAQAAGKAFPDVPTNFFLFFDSRQFPRTGSTAMAAMPGMKMPGMKMAGMSH